MYKKCEEILSKLQCEGKIKISDYQFPSKQELKLRLKDMLESEVEEKYYLSSKMIDYVLASGTKTFYCKPEIDLEIAKPLNATMTKMHRSGVDNYVSDKLIQVGELDIKGNDSIKRVYSNEGLSPTLTDMQGGNRQPKVLIKEATKQGYKEAYIGDGINISSRMEYQRGNVQKETIQTITTSGGSDRGVVLNDLRIRKLTPKECWRLMGFNDEDFDKASQVNSNSQLYKQAGNSIVVNVLEAILKSLLEREE